MAAHKTVFNDKQRILRLYSALISHRALSIEEIEDMFFIGRKTVQRDISEIRTFCMICKSVNQLNLRLFLIVIQRNID